MRGVDHTPGWSAAATGEGTDQSPPSIQSPPSTEQHVAAGAASNHPVSAPPIQYVETALLPRLLEPPEEPPSLKELAQRHGLRIASSRPTLGSYIAQLWRFRQFIATYANGRAAVKLGRARLGRLWQILSPIVNVGIYYLIFGVILGTSRNVENFIAYLSIGVFLFTFTQGVVNSAVTSISGQRGLLRALHFPRASLPIAQTLTHVQTLAFSVVVLAGIVFLTREPVILEWLYLLPALALQFVFNLGLALLVARLGSRIPDLRQLLPYMLRVWMYASGVLYSVTVFEANLPAWAVPVVHANPLLVYIELARHSLMENVPLTSSVTQLWITGGIWALVAFGVGFVYFWRGEAEYGRE